MLTHRFTSPRSLPRREAPPVRGDPGQEGRPLPDLPVLADGARVRGAVGRQQEGAALRQGAGLPAGRHLVRQLVVALPLAS